jgi:hypothetical protein
MRDELMTPFHAKSSAGIFEFSICVHSELENSILLIRESRLFSEDTVINQNEKKKVSSTLLSLRLDAQPTVTY